MIFSILLVEENRHMAAITNTNIKSTFCFCVLVQGSKCPAGRRGKVCTRAHTIDEVQPRPCLRENGEGGCRCKDRQWPFTCVFLHKGESVEEDYPKRLGFDPEHKAFDNKTVSEIETLFDELSELKKRLQETLARFDLDNIPKKDMSYVRMTQSSLKLIGIKEDFLAEKKWQAENREIQAFEDEMGRLEAEGAYDEPHKDDNGDRFFRTPEEKAKNREKVRAMFKKGKYVKVEDVFESKNDEACYEEFSEMTEQDAPHDMECSYAEMRVSIIKYWVESVIAIWDREDKGEKFEDLHLKDAWGNYRDFDRQKAEMEAEEE
uniref:Uncharacterized protein n=1 Tax=viral metagenome TaxID=1070528 RepID=A0A6C0LSV8_9ZZZZ